MDLIYLMHGGQEIVAALSAAATIAFSVLWTPFAERRRVLSEEAAIKVVLGAELRLHAGYTLEAFQRVAALMTSPEHKGIENAATIRAFVAARLAEPLVYPNVAGKLGSVGASADRVVDFYTRRTVLRDSILRTPEHYQPEYALSPAQLLSIGQALLGAAECADEALGAFPAPVSSKRPEVLSRQVAEARLQFEKLTVLPPANPASPFWVAAKPNQELTAGPRPPHPLGRGGRTLDLICGDTTCAGTP